MQGIPRALYARIERELHAQPGRAAMAAEDALMRRREDAHGLKSPAFDGAGKAGGPSNRVQDGALRVIEAERMLETRRKWADVAAQLDAAFAGTKTGEVARLLYTDGRRASEIAGLLGVDRQTVKKRRAQSRLQQTNDELTALLAAERGLIRMSDYAEDRRST